MNNILPWKLPIVIPRHCYAWDNGPLREITPTEFKRRKKWAKNELSRMRIELEQVRSERAAARDQWDLDQADGHLGIILQDHRRVRIELLFLRKVPVKKFAHVSPRAEQRLRARFDIRD